MESFKLVVDAVLFGTVGLEDAFALGSSRSTCLAFAVSTVTCVLGVGDFVGAEFLFFVAVNDLLFLKGIMFTLFVRDFSREVVEHTVDLIDWSTSLHHVGDLSEDSLLAEEGGVLELSSLGKG